MSEQSARASHYGSYYRDFAAGVYADIRREEFGEDLGQNNWQTLAELEGFAGRLALAPGVRLLDVACGAGGPGLHLARLTGCEVTGVDRERPGLANGRSLARAAGLETRVRFVEADASVPLPFADGSFGAILCLDALNHLPGRFGVFTDWARLLTPGGRLLVTDPVTITGLVAADELAVRSSIGYFEFAPPGADERLLTAAGLRVLAIEDLTETVAAVARRRCGVRAERAQELRALEGEDGFERRQRFLDMVATLAAERRMSRFAYLAEKPRVARASARGRRFEVDGELRGRHGAHLLERRTAEQLDEDERAVPDAEYGELRDDDVDGGLRGQRIGALRHDLGLAARGRRRHGDDHTARADDQIHRATDAEHVLPGHRPVGDVAGRADLERSEHRDVDVSAADHREALGTVEVRRSGERRHGALGRVDHVGVELVLVRTGPDAEQPVLGVEVDAGVIVEERRDHVRDADAEVHDLAGVELERGACRDRPLRVVAHVCTTSSST